MTSSHITSWKIDGETMETVTDFYLLGLQNHCDCGHKIERCLLLGRKVFNFMAAVTVCSDFGAQENKSLSLFPFFPHLFAMK